MARVVTLDNKFPWLCPSLQSKSSNYWWQPIFIWSSLSFRKQMTSRDAYYFSLALGVPGNQNSSGVFSAALCALKITPRSADKRKSMSAIARNRVMLEQCTYSFVVQLVPREKDCLLEHLHQLDESETCIAPIQPYSQSQSWEIRSDRINLKTKGFDESARKAHLSRSRRRQRQEIWLTLSTEVGMVVMVLWRSKAAGIGVQFDGIKSSLKIVDIRVFTRFLALFTVVITRQLHLSEATIISSKSGRPPAHCSQNHWYSSSLREMGGPCRRDLTVPDSETEEGHTYV
ncbi:hypothetical protein DFH06DRAFT_1424349 [Mycena polygramma]|nr:hypothetical protein DFH06DRAFT_1424349 [Mycena polygramma]